MIRYSKFYAKLYFLFLKICIKLLWEPSMLQANSCTRVVHWFERLFVMPKFRAFLRKKSKKKSSLSVVQRLVLYNFPTIWVQFTLPKHLFLKLEGRRYLEIYRASCCSFSGTADYRFIEQPPIFLLERSIINPLQKPVSKYFRPTQLVSLIKQLKTKVVIHTFY